MNFIDTHAHLYLPDFHDDFDDVVIRAKNAGVLKILLPNIDIDSIELLKQTVQSDSSFFIPMMGLHPTAVKEDWEYQLDIIYHELKTNPYIGIGEIGIDLYRDQTFKMQQIKAFEKQLQWSIEMNLPVVIHLRNANSEVLQSIENVGMHLLRGVFHSFGGSKEELNTILKLPSFFVGINGIVTFKNSGLSDVLADCDIERIVLETDAPYLAPVPYRGKRNEPAYLTKIAKKLSDIFGIPVEEVARITTQNAAKLVDISNWE
ncbi:TatD family hydrolase [Anaerorudis cellulosivorans]|uniref:TatD family hydrolase n=1 Tax=Anaerorudis cellulosivorans TaxID=3397862 RepID=UPI002220E5A4|nr:TatD family hydrolase [Seramator thermalis]MCW1735596.1 TatD family hydrolase [Seramator thermalis]